MNQIKFLDCTLRDGGYYNGWDFDPENAKQLIAALNKAGANIIELGYKTTLGKDKYYGLFKYCNEEYFPYLCKEDPADYAFMIDVKEFLCEDGGVDEEALDMVVKPVHESFFSWVRLASHYKTIEDIPAMTAYFRKKGYQVAFNLMGGSLLSREQIKDGLEIATKAEVDVFYLADSFGSFYPDDIRELIRFLKANYEGALGMHTHDNQGMAYANTLTAIEEGVDFVDGTVTGMGRGAGNLLTEQFLMGYASRFEKPQYNANALLKVIEEYIQPLKDHYKWGHSLTYMFSGLQNIHPTYCQNLIESNRYTMEEISSILAKIPQGKRSKFNVQTLESAVKAQLKSELHEGTGTTPRFELTNFKSDTSIIVAKGPQARNHVTNIVDMADRQEYDLVECNETGFFQKEDKRILAISNQVRLNDWIKHKEEFSQTILASGFPIYAEDLRGGYYPFTIGDFDASDKELCIPDYDAGLYAIGLAMKAGAKEVLLAGFDGYKDETMNKLKEMHFRQISDYAVRQNIKIIHITPTTYNVFPERSLYEF